MSATEEPQKLYAAREPVFPKRVKGRFRNLKWVIMIVTLGIYYLTPWIRWDRGPSLPDQAVLLDLANRRFFFFWIEIWPHEFYFVAGLLIMAGLGLFLFTSALGRVWCGYTCPQTVWTDLFFTVERWIEGDRNARLRLWKQDWNFKKFRLRVVKYIVWLLIAVATGGAWVFYFADAPTLLVDLVTLQAPYVAYTTIGVLTATTFVFGGFMREQVCIYMCPWPRIQAAMMDEQTITVAYRDWRGEPRGKHRKGQENTELGDCIDCMACVNVCPVGIDIRDGQQLECITCALCIDACDDIMAKIGKPRGLVDYMALTDETNERAGKDKISVWKHIFRLRTIIYTVLWSAIGIGLTVLLFIRSDIDMTVAAVRNPQYVTLSDGSIRNTYDVRIRNMTHQTSDFRVSLGEGAPFILELEGSDDETVEVPIDSTLLQRVYVIAPAGTEAAATERTDFRLWIEDLSTNTRSFEDTTFFGRETE
ncbi:Type cbb3 cytochrome oxidase biogenesis protein CcoG [Roseibacterium elongatum DSM 19469]|uniref:Type cbb3 cytochrome oxidase biogenesis protein CcoG n=1 Tax=Roseicyclus elongatus DSM 19469 TaxID=1294273 RepID=W8SKM5_9RHOB|nr:cytochrome c oxidase accessory protein CcoG [Roseibacterium elongatum]AHM03070.1 Type cbb3 cytochrome oxidase biogenesis protein CcoG [Roseibacterium elongatum DSM 19469]